MSEVALSLLGGGASLHWLFHSQPHVQHVYTDMSCDSAPQTPYKHKLLVHKGLCMMTYKPLNMEQDTIDIIFIFRITDWLRMVTRPPEPRHSRAHEYLSQTRCHKMSVSCPATAIYCWWQHWLWDVASWCTSQAAFPFAEHYHYAMFVRLNTTVL